MKKNIFVFTILFSLLCKVGLPQDRSNDNLSDSFSFYTINRYQKNTADFDETDDTRNFTSEALFIESANRLNRPLSDDELKRIIRAKDQFETFNDLRFRFKKNYIFDLFYKYRYIDDAQITNFYEPNEFNNVNFNQFGLAFTSNFSIESYDIFLRGAYKYIDREGIIEFFPNVEEKINEFEINAMFSKSFNGFRATLFPTYVFQDIDPNIDNPPTRKRNIAAIALTLGDEKSQINYRPENIIGKSIYPGPVFRSENIYERRFDIRIVNLFILGAGIVYDVETYGSIDVEKFDYFFNAAFRLGSNSPLIIKIQPEIFTSTVEDDDSQDNAQYRTNLSLNYQLDKYSLLFTIPWRHDIAIQGPEDFENWKGGCEINYYFSNKYINSLFTIGYYYQDFFKVEKELNLFAISLNLEF